MSRLRRWLVWTAVTLGCGACSVVESTHPDVRGGAPISSDFRRVELPGFSIDVPTGLGAGNGRVSDYRQGMFRMQGVHDVLSVTWSTAPLPPPEALAFALGGMLDGASFAPDTAQAFKLGSLDAIRARAVVNDNTVDLTIIACGSRTATLVFGGDEPVRLRDHIVASFDCHPSARDEAALVHKAPVAVDAPRILLGWYEVANNTAYTITNDHLLMMIYASPHSATLHGDDDIESGFIPTGVFRTMMSAFHWTNTRLEKRRARDGHERQFQLATVNLGADTVEAVLTAWRCTDHTLVVIAEAAPGARVDAAIDVIMHMRCARPGDPPLLRK